MSKSVMDMPERTWIKLSTREEFNRWNELNPGARDAGGEAIEFSETIPYLCHIGSGLIVQCMLEESARRSSNGPEYKEYKMPATKPLWLDDFAAGKVYFHVTEQTEATILKLLEDNGMRWCGTGCMPTTWSPIAKGYVIKEYFAFCSGPKIKGSLTWASSPTFHDGEKTDITKKAFGIPDYVKPSSKIASVTQPSTATEVKAEPKQEEPISMPPRSWIRIDNDHDFRHWELFNPGTGVKRHPSFCYLARWAHGPIEWFPSEAVAKAGHSEFQEYKLPPFEMPERPAPNIVVDQPKPSKNAEYHYTNPLYLSAEMGNAICDSMTGGSSYGGMCDLREQSCEYTPIEEPKKSPRRRTVFALIAASMLGSIITSECYPIVRNWVTQNVVVKW